MTHQKQTVQSCEAKSSHEAPTTNQEEEVKPASKTQTRMTFGLFAKIFGPGFLISIAYLDPGNISGDIEAGITGGYALNWVLVLSTVLGGMFQYIALKLAIITGKDLAHHAREQYSKKISIFLWLMIELAIIGSDCQEVLGTASGFYLLFGFPIWLGVLLSIALALILLLSQNYGQRKLELLFAFFVGILALTCFTNLSREKVNFEELILGFVPTIPKGSGLAAIALLGSIIMPHNLYLHSSIVLNRGDGLETNLFDKKVILRAYKLEIFITLMVSALINIGIIDTFANFQGSENIDILSAGKLLAGSMGLLAQYFWGIGLVASGQSSTMSGTLAGQYVMNGFINMRMSPLGRIALTRSIAVIPCLGLVFISSIGTLNLILNILQATQLPFTLIPLIAIASSKAIMGDKRLHPFLGFLGLIVGLLMVIGNMYEIFLTMDFDKPVKIFTICTIVVYFMAIFGLICTKLHSNKQVKVPQEALETEPIVEKENAEVKIREPIKGDLEGSQGQFV